MDLSRLLPEHHCVVRMKKESSLRDMLTHLVEPLVASGVVTDGGQFLDDVLAREEQLTTVVGNGTALPHARSQAVSRLGLVVGLFDEGEEQDFPGSNEEEGVQVVFLIAVPAFMPAAHLPLLKHVAKFIGYDRKIGKLLKSRTPAAACKYLQSYKG